MNRPLRLRRSSAVVLATAACAVLAPAAHALRTADPVSPTPLPVQPAMTGYDPSVSLIGRLDHAPQPWSASGSASIGSATAPLHDWPTP